MPITACLCVLQAIRHDEHTGAPTLLYCIRVDRGISWEQASARLEDAQAGRKHTATAAGQPKAGQAPAAAAQRPPSVKQEPDMQVCAADQPVCMFLYHLHQPQNANLMLLL